MISHLVHIRRKAKGNLYRKYHQKKKLEIKPKVETLFDKQLLLREYCFGFDLCLLENGWSEITYLLTPDLSWKRACQCGIFRPLYILNFDHSGANENENSTGLAPSMTSSHVTSHVTRHSAVFLILKHTRRQMLSDDVLLSGVDSIVLLGDVNAHIR